MESAGRELPPPIAIEVVHPDDIPIARQLSKQMSATIGFDEKEREEIAIAVSELASNLVKHAKDGKMVFTQLSEGSRLGLQVESYDAGPGIADLERVTTDGFSTTGSLGSGLGAVNRLMDTFDITSQMGVGTHIVCKRWRRTSTWSITHCPLEFGIATRPHPAMQVNGDAFVIKRWGEHALVGVIDGLGHGQFAHRAAETARQYVETHWDQPLDAIFRGVALACRATRGVVMALARFDLGDMTWRSHLAVSTPASAMHLTFASIGNVEMRVFGSVEPHNFIVRRGVLGGSAPSPVVTEHRWASPSIMVLHSDGLTTHWRWEDFPVLTDTSATDAAHHLLRTLQKDDDDATVVVVKAAPEDERNG